MRIAPVAAVLLFTASVVAQQVDLGVIRDRAAAYVVEHARDLGVDRHNTLERPWWPSNDAICYRQFISGVRVESEDAFCYATDGSIKRHMIALPTNFPLRPRVAEDEALKIAAQYGEISSTLYEPTTELVIVPSGVFDAETTLLAWKTQQQGETRRDAKSHGPGGYWQTWVDAHSGRVVHEEFSRENCGGPPPMPLPPEAHQR